VKSQGRRAAIWRPVVAVGLILVAVALWLELPFFSEDPLDACPGYAGLETTSYSTSSTLWPPGATECEWTTPGGDIRHSTYVPWSEWLILGLVFTAVALVYSWLYAGASARERKLFAAVVVPGGLLAFVFVVLVGAWASILIPPLLVAGIVTWTWGRA
jgi:hypothetical protein